ncbi:MAG: hypothetical protein PHI58_04730 [Candidatus Omnitrophica bacterium]|nr:hypothetical protein [Candidatus Omnitrophota bacterium]
MRYLFVALAVFCCAPFCHADEMSVYKFDDLKFQIECPQDYETKKMSGAYSNTVAVVLGGRTGKNDFKPNITISSVPNSTPPIDLKRFFNLYLQNFLKDENFEVILAEKTKLGNKEVYQLRYKHRVMPTTGKKVPVSIEVLQVYVIEPRRLYVMNYTATEADFGVYLETVNEIFKSFKTI